MMVVMFSDGRTHIETWIPAVSSWECHAANAVQQVLVDAVLLYCMLPEGITGDRLKDHLQLQEELHAQGALSS